MKKINILLVEDNEGDILLTTEAFDDFKIDNTITVIKNGKLALEYVFKKGEFINTVRPDLIILDINLPFKNGLEVLEIIKSNVSVQSIPVIMLSTSCSEKEIKKAYDNHCNGFLTKPIDILDLLKAILSIEEFGLNIVLLPK